VSWLRLAFANLGLSPLTTTVNVVLMALGTASIVLLLLVGAQLAETLSRDAKGIDLVLGAKGSPVQLVLSAVYHADVPTGNISEHEAERWAEDPRVKQAIPVSLGDSYLGFRIVGTTHDYASLYGAEVAQGKLWSESMEVVVGSAVHGAGLGLGTTFSGVHGLQDGGEHHDAQPYLVAGVLTPTGTVLDRLILTSSESVWDLHDEEGHGDHAEEDHADDDHEEDGHEEHDEDEHDEHTRTTITPTMITKTKRTMTRNMKNTGIIMTKKIMRSRRCCSLMQRR